MAIEEKTKTFAGIYESQGHYGDALNIYIDLLKGSPLDEELTESIRRLQSLIQEKNSERKKIMDTQISVLEGFLHKTYAYKNSPA